MQPEVERALAVWDAAFTNQQEAAVTAATTAFPLLRRMPYPTGCCHLRMKWERAGLGEGTVCVDDQARGTLNFRYMPQARVGAALDTLVGRDWFDDVTDGITTAGPGTYYWSDEDHGGEWEVKVGADGRLDMLMDFMPIPDVIGVLDATHTMLAAA